jgi:hypothetical protein
VNGPERVRGVASRLRVGGIRPASNLDLHAPDGERPDDFLLSDD